MRPVGSLRFQLATNHWPLTATATTAHFFFSDAWAAAKRAIGTRNGEQLT